MATATRKETFDACKNPGDFFLTGNDAIQRLSFLCPCGCGILAGINVSVTPNTNSWWWNGDSNCPTATPSIAVLDGPNQNHWHGYLTNGEFKVC